MKISQMNIFYQKNQIYGIKSKHSGLYIGVRGGSGQKLKMYKKLEGGTIDKTI